MKLRLFQHHDVARCTQNTADQHGQQLTDADTDSGDVDLLVETLLPDTDIEAQCTAMVRVDFFEQAETACPALYSYCQRKGFFMAVFVERHHLPVP